MTFNVRDRILLLNILPKEGDVTTIRLVRQLRMDLSFSEEEHAQLHFIHGENGAISWTDGDLSKEITVGPRARLLIAEVLRQLDTSKKLTPEYLDLYDAFVETKD